MAAARRVRAAEAAKRRPDDLTVIIDAITARLRTVEPMIFATGDRGVSAAARYDEADKIRALALRLRARREVT